MGNIIGSNNEFPSVLFEEQASAPTTPASGFWRAYFKSDGMYVVDDAGTETGPFGTGSGSATFVGARAYNSAVQNLANNTATAVTFDTELFDTDTIHSTASNTSRFTVPSGKGGKWRFTTNIAFAANATGWRGIYLFKNGTTKIIGSAMRHLPTSGASTSCVTSVTIDLVATDYIEVYAIQTSGGALDIGHATATELQSAMEAVFLG